MAILKFEGLDEYVRVLNRMAGPKEAEGIIKAAVYPGAAIVADAIRANAEEHRRTGDMAASLNLSTMRNENGYIYTQVGFVGTDRRGVPNQIKANALESGTSKQRKTPFIRPAVRASQAKAEAAMAAELDKQIKKIMEG